MSPFLVGVEQAHSVLQFYADCVKLIWASTVGLLKLNYATDILPQTLNLQVYLQMMRL